MSKFADYVPGRDGAGAPLSESEGLVIRAAAKADLAPLAAIAAEREGGPVEDWEERFERLYAEVASGAGALLVAALAGEPLGYGKVAFFSPRPGSPGNVTPAGWYLTGLVVKPAFRRRGVGMRLTAARLAWIAERSREAFYVANAKNQATIDLHQKLGFVERTRDFSHPHVRFEGGAGILFTCHLAGP
jgi:ribosomal protein S18 acetylase RimI-like enzyme